MIGLKNLSIKAIQPIMMYLVGMKQHSVIDMLGNAKYRIADEICSGLDIDNRKYFFHQIYDLKAQGKIIFLSSYYKEEFKETYYNVLAIKRYQLNKVILYEL